MVHREYQISADTAAEAGRPTQGVGLPGVPALANGPPAAVQDDQRSTSSMSTTEAIRSVMRVTPLRRLWYSTALSSLGDWLGLLATTALAASLATGYKQQSYALGGVLVVRLLPAMVLGPLAGAFADRFDRRWTMVMSDFLRFALFLTIPLAHLVVDAHKTLVWLYVASFLIECVSLFWMPAKDASVPNLVRKDQLEAANQLSLITTYGVTPVLGAALFSVLSLITNVLARHLSFFRTNPTNLALYFNAGTFLFGALVVLFIDEISGHRGRSRGQRAAEPFQASSRGCELHPLVRARRRHHLGPGRRLRGRRCRDRRRAHVRHQPRRWQRGLRRAVRVGVRRARHRHGAGAPAWPASCRDGGCSVCRSSWAAAAWR